LAHVLRELQLGVDRDGNLDRIEAALTQLLHQSSYRKPQTRLAVTRTSSAQMVLQPFGRALQLRQSRQALHAHHAACFEGGAHEWEPVTPLRLRNRGRIILFLLWVYKKNSKFFRALVQLLILAVAAAPAFAQVFKWVDERGVTHYGERPPQGAKATEVQDKLA